MRGIVRVREGEKLLCTWRELGIGKRGIDFWGARLRNGYAAIAPL